MMDDPGCKPLPFAVLAGLLVFIIVTAVSAAENAKVEQPKPPGQVKPTEVTNSVPASTTTVVPSPAPAAPFPNDTAVKKEEKSEPAPTSAKDSAEKSTLSIYMPDGQLKSHLVRVYLSRDIDPDLNPALQLYRSHAVTKKAAEEDRVLSPTLIAPNQEWIQPLHGAQVRRTGTVMLFDLSELDFGARAMVRVRPVVRWEEGGAKVVAVGVSEVNVGNIVLAIIYSALAVIVLLLFLALLSLKARRSPLLLLIGVDGHLSLSQTQVACWTIAVGSVVLIYGMIRLELPAIPDSLVVLMGTSLATGGVAYFADAKIRQKKIDTGARPAQYDWSIADLIRVVPDGEEPELSLAKAQMVFWTVILLALFIFKSVLDGTMWDIPWQLVALMGFSQAGYLAPKLAKQVQEQPAEPEQAAKT